MSDKQSLPREGKNIPRSGQAGRSRAAGDTGLLMGRNCLIYLLAWKISIWQRKAREL